ncbi:MAG: cyclic di-GMP phosphodiesterase, partial [Solirubrobacteraceae bacterium]|nr:cyclic di-GMP phosphodiesterase [Solirubrobacteraceae bacterium]
MIVDDDAAIVAVLQSLLGGWGFLDVVATTDSSEAVGICAECEPDLVLLDLNMPSPDGFEVMDLLRPWSASRTPMPILVLTADPSPAIKRRALASGARDFLTKPFDAEEVRLRVNNLLETRRLQQDLARHGEELERRVRDRTAQVDEARAELLDRLALAAEYRDDETGEHTQRVGRTAGRLAEELGLPRATVELIRRAAPLHDIGKLAIADAILLKPGRLTSAEREQMKRHATIGAQILSGSRSPLLQTAEQIALSHHEHWDGSGYPSGLSGEAIPLAGRIVAVADVYDAISHERPYKKAWPIDEAVAEIARHAGGQFDPRVAAAFASLDHEWLRSPTLAAVVPQGEGWTDALTASAGSPELAPDAPAHRGPSPSPARAPVPDHALTLGEAAAALKISSATLRRWGASGRIRELRTPGGHRRFLATEVRRLNSERNPGWHAVVAPVTPPGRPIPSLGAVLATAPEDLIERATSGMYGASAGGWFCSDRGADSAAGWVRAVASACLNGDYSVAERATA